MGVFRKVGSGLSWAYKPAVDVKAWMGWDIIKSSSRYVYGLGKEVFVPAEAKHQESFEEAMERLHLSETDIQDRQKEFARLFLIYALMGLAIFIYSIVLFFKMAFMGGILAIVVSALAFGMAFRQHFWLFQIKHRKLGCSLSEWYHSKIDEQSSNTEGQS